MASSYLVWTTLNSSITCLKEAFSLGRMRRHIRDIKQASERQIQIFYFDAHYKLHGFWDWKTTFIKNVNRDWSVEEHLFIAPFITEIRQKLLVANLVSILGYSWEKMYGVFTTLFFKNRSFFKNVKTGNDSYILDLSFCKFKKKSVCWRLGPFVLIERCVESCENEWGRENM